MVGWGLAGSTFALTKLSSSSVPRMFGFCGAGMVGTGSRVGEGLEKDSGISKPVGANAGDSALIAEDAYSTASSSRSEANALFQLESEQKR